MPGVVLLFASRIKQKYMSTVMVAYLAVPHESEAKKALFIKDIPIDICLGVHVLHDNRWFTVTDII